MPPATRLASARVESTTESGHCRVTMTQPPDPTPAATPSATPADRLAIDPDSPYHDATQLARGIGVRFKGVERTDVEEFSVSEGWVRVALGKKVDRRGRPLTVKLSGPVEVWFHDAADDAAAPAGDEAVGEA